MNGSGSPESNRVTSRQRLRPITGALLARIVGYSLLEGWIVLSIILYVFAGAFWLPVVWVQMRMRDLATAAVINDRSLRRGVHRKQNECARKKSNKTKSNKK